MNTNLTGFITRHVPLLETLRGHDRAALKHDLTAGLTTAVMLVPQGMAYAMLAGLPPIVGLYASTVPLVLYALFGSSRQLAVGPVAMVSLLVASGIGAMGPASTAETVALAVLLAAMVGAIQLAMGIGRLGFLVNFLSHPVVSGFTSAAALIIGLSQLKHLLGLEIPRSHHVHTIILSALGQLDRVQPITLGIGVAAMASLMLLRRWRPTFPGALAVVVLGTAAVALFGLDSKGVDIVGTVPQGLPGVALPAFSLAAMKELWPIALTISLVGFMESISVAKAFARKHHYQVDANRELVGLGLANLGGALVGAYPVTGGFSRTAVNAQAGARSGLAAIITAAVIATTLLLLTPLFYYLPRAVLAAIIMVAVFGLVDLKEVLHLWRVKRSDLAMLLITFGATLALGIEQGIIVGVVSSLLVVILRTTRPHTAVLGQVPGTHAYRNLANNPGATTTPGVIALRMDAQFYFGNVNFLKETIHRLERDCTEPLRAMVINAASINNMDASAAAALEEIIEDLEARGVALFFAEVRLPVLEVMRRAGLVDRLGEDHFYLTVRRAVEAAAAVTPPGRRPDAALPETANRGRAVTTTRESRIEPAASVS